MESFEMWSSRAEEVVSRLIAGRTPGPGMGGVHAQRLGALPIGVDMWADYYLRPSGEVVIVGADLDQPDEDTVITDPRRLLSVLVWGSWRYPELREVLPAREPGAADCLCLLHPEIFRPGKFICPECGGLGWLPAGPV